MHGGPSYYDLIGVSVTATPDEIKAAYRAAMLRYHPDVNAAPNAQRLTELLNEAYEVLSDAQKRRDYDAAMSSGRAYSTNEPQTELYPLYGCDRCGRIDPHLRFAIFYRVFSLIIFTQRASDGGVLCAQCRSAFATSTAIFSALLGPWGFWMGPLYTLEALYTAIVGGAQPWAPNVELLRHQGVAFLQRGAIDEARTAFTDSLRFQRNAEVSELLKEPVFVGSRVLPRRRWTGGQTTALLITVLPIVVLVTYYSLFVPHESSQLVPPPAASYETSTSVTAASEAQPGDVADAASFERLKKQCIAAADTRAKAQAVYDACVKVRAVANDAIQDSSTSADTQQEARLVDDESRIYQGNAALRLGRTEEARALYNASNKDLEDLKSSGITDDIRRQAAADYECAVHQRCSP